MRCNIAHIIYTFQICSLKNNDDPRLCLESTKIFECVILSLRLGHIQIVILIFLFTVESYADLYSVEIHVINAFKNGSHLITEQMLIKSLPGFFSTCAVTLSNQVILCPWCKRSLSTACKSLPATSVWPAGSFHSAFDLAAWFCSLLNWLRAEFLALAASTAARALLLPKKT